jgi:hypothetical protein
VWRKTTKGKEKREKDKGKTRGSMKKIRQLFCCLIKYGGVI